MGFSPYLSVYVIVNAVTGLAPGAYYYNRFYNGLRLLQEGEFRETAGHLGFEQALPADAAAVAFITADLPLIEREFGTRGYRMAQTVAGIIGGRIYLASHSLGLGATGPHLFRRCRDRIFRSPLQRAGNGVRGADGRPAPGQPGAAVPVPACGQPGFPRQGRRSSLTTLG